MLPPERSLHVDYPIVVTDHLIAKLATRVELSAADRVAIAALPCKLRTIDQSTYMLREGQRPLRCAFVIDGFAYRQKLTPDGEREIVSILMPGDFIDLQNLFLEESDHDVQALTRITVAEIPIPALREIVAVSPKIATALWIEALVEASIHREWLLNVGRRNAKMRLAHLLCEFSARLRASSLSDADGSYELPMTQEQMGDALGLTPVHVNRVLRALETDGLITRRKRQIGVVDWCALRDAAEFSERYLHLTQTRP